MHVSGRFQSSDTYIYCSDAYIWGGSIFHHSIKGDKAGNREIMTDNTNIKHLPINLIYVISIKAKAIIYTLWDNDEMPV